jgi:hypothetical protein
MTYARWWKSGDAALWREMTGVAAEWLMEVTMTVFREDVT